MLSSGKMATQLFPMLSLATGIDKGTSKSIIDVRRRRVISAAVGAGNTTSSAHRSFASNWQNLNGKDHWKGLLDPLDADLRQYIIHYGELTQATYDSFNSNKWSKHAGHNFFTETDFFSKVGLDKASPYKYSVSKFFYATSSAAVPNRFFLKSMSREAWNKESNWIGYVAVVNDDAKELMGRRDIVVAWRGTIQALEWSDDFDSILVSAADLFGKKDNQDTMIHDGFKKLYTTTDPRSTLNQISARDQIAGEVKRLVELYKDEEISITVTGHSLGAAMATLTAADIIINKVNKPASNPGKPCPVTAIVFASPKLGDKSLMKTCANYDELRILRIRNNNDSVPDTPLFGFSECGEVLHIDTTKSPYLKPTSNKGDYHNLEGYLHGVAGTQGSKGGFNLEIPRSLGLVNKSMDGLKDEYHVPPCWWTLQNKGMTQLDDGSWELIDYNL